MAVNALELRPRNAIALFDAAVRMCATTGGVWAITLPASGALVAALFNLGTAIERHTGLGVPVLWFTLAWAARAVSQGAACYHLDRQILSTEPTARESFAMGLKRAPGLITASAVMALLNAAILTFSAGLGFFFVGAHAAGYAAIMRGQGSALNVYGTAARLLGSARYSAPWVRLCGLTQLFVWVNLFLAVTAALSLVKSLLGFDVSFLERFTSVHNGLWLASVAAVTFALFEPLRAAVGTLLLIDGRVRQEGLDLLAAAEQLPRRRRRGPALGAAGLVALLAFPAAGQELTSRLEAIASVCSMDAIDLGALEALGSLDERDRLALAHFVARLEHTAHDEEDCEGAEAALRSGLALMRPSLSPAEARGDPKALAVAALARPEFAAAPPVEEVDPAPEERSWWDELLRWVTEWLKSTPRETPARWDSSGSSMVGANAVMIIAVVAIIAMLGYLLERGLRRAPAQENPVEELVAVETTGINPSSALAKPPEGWASLADELAARGSFREAIRHLYLALLARLHHDGVIDYDPTRSNWEYLSTLKGPPQVRSAFRDLTSRFDFAWYGHLDVTRPAWAAFRRVAGPLLAPPSAEGAHG